MKHAFLLMTLGSVALTAALAEVPSGPPTFSDPLTIDNAYHPFVVGRVKSFEGSHGNLEVQVADSYLAGTRDFAWGGSTVSCRTLQESESEDGELAEISFNYFAQADDGTVYYFGEVVDVYEGGVVVGHSGSWLVGGPTLPGDPPETAVASDPTVYMPAHPEDGDVFKPEDLMPFVDESDEIVKVDKTVKVPAGTFEDCIQILESSQLSAGTETKWYAPEVGVIKVKEKGEALVLVDITP
jgi:hypothetical protein